jgi:hypothetical protein
MLDQVFAARDPLSPTSISARPLLFSASRRMEARISSHIYKLSTTYNKKSAYLLCIHFDVELSACVRRNRPLQRHTVSHHEGLACSRRGRYGQRCTRPLSVPIHLYNSIIVLIRFYMVDIFQYLTANGVKGGQYQNVRRNTNYNSPVVGTYLGLE